MNDARSFPPAFRLSAALWLFFSLAAGPALLFPPRAAADDSEAVVGVVSAFYRNYITALLKSFAGEKVDYDYRKQPEVDAALVLKIEKLVEEAQESELGALEYDPILMAQDVPKSMRYAKPIIKGGSAELIAYTLWGDGGKQAICVALAKKDNAWRIIDLIDMEEEEAPQECGGLKTGGKAR